MLTLVAEKRDITGKKVRHLRRQGKLPVVAYGPGKETIHLTVDGAEFLKLYRQAGESTMIGLETPEGRFEAIVQDVARDPVSEELLHADLYMVERGKKIEVTVPFEFTGVSPAVKSYGGTLVKVMHEVDVEVLPSQIPHEIVVDITPLATLEDVITIGDLVLPEGVKVLAESDEIVVSVATQNDSSDDDTASAEIDFSAIEAQKKGKKEEDQSSE